MVTTKAFMHSNTSLQTQSARHFVSISGRSLAGVQATSGARAPGFGALPHLHAVVEQVSGATSDKCTGRKAAVLSPHTQSSAQVKCTDHQTWARAFSHAATDAECQTGQLTSG